MVHATKFKTHDAIGFDNCDQNWKPTVRVMLSMNSFMKSSEIKNRNRVRYDDKE